MSKTYRRRLRRQQAGVQAPQGGPDFVSPEDQFRMSLDKRLISAQQLSKTVTAARWTPLASPTLSTRHPAPPVAFIAPITSTSLPTAGCAAVSTHQRPDGWGTCSSRAWRPCLMPLPAIRWCSCLPGVISRRSLPERSRPGAISTETRTTAVQPLPWWRASPGRLRNWNAAQGERPMSGSWSSFTGKFQRSTGLRPPPSWLQAPNDPAGTTPYCSIRDIVDRAGPCSFPRFLRQMLPLCRSRVTAALFNPSPN